MQVDVPMLLLGLHPIAQVLAAHEPYGSPLTSGNHILGDIALKKTACPTIHKAFHYSKIPSRDNNNAIGHQQTALGEFLLVQLGTRT